MAARRVWSNAYLLLTFTALFWAGNAIVGRAVRDLFPPIGLAFWRWLFALAIVLPFAWPHLRRDGARLRAAWPRIAFLGALGIGAFNSLLYTGLGHTSALNAMLLQSGQPGLILLFGVLFMRDRTNLRQLTGAGIALMGVLTIIARGDPGVIAALQLNIGDLIIAVAVVLWSIYSVFLRKRPAVHPLSFFAATLLVGVCAILPFYAWEIARGDLIQARLESGLALAYVAIFPSIVAYLFFNRAVELIGSASTGIYMNVMPVIGAGLAIAFLGESVRPFHAVGLAFIVGGVLLAGRGPSAPAVPLGRSI
jgi:drug/metabolite transporter (DMT)-like permease